MRRNRRVTAEGDDERDDGDEGEGAIAAIAQRGQREKRRGQADVDAGGEWLVAGAGALVVERVQEPIGAVARAEGVGPEQLDEALRRKREVRGLGQGHATRAADARDLERGTSCTAASAAASGRPTATATSARLRSGCVAASTTTSAPANHAACGSPPRIIMAGATPMRTGDVGVDSAQPTQAAPTA